MPCRAARRWSHRPPAYGANHLLSARTAIAITQSMLANAGSETRRAAINCNSIAQTEYTDLGCAKWFPGGTGSPTGPGTQHHARTHTLSLRALPS